MALSDQLATLADRTKRLEDAAAATDEQNRKKLEADREKLHSTMQAEALKIQESAKAAKTQERSWWADLTARMEQRRAELRAKMDQRRFERKADRAMRIADDAENYAVDMVSAAVYSVDAAEYAVIDAAIARAEAEDVTASQTPG